MWIKWEKKKKLCRFGKKETMMIIIISSPGTCICDPSIIDVWIGWHGKSNSQSPPFYIITVVCTQFF